jgi:S4 domain
LAARYAQSINPARKSRWSHATSPPRRVPLERALSKLGLASRTQARALIQAGRLAADGQTQTDPLLPVVPEQVRLSAPVRKFDDVFLSFEARSVDVLWAHLILTNSLTRSYG